MTIQEIERYLKSHAKEAGLISRKELQKAWGCSASTVDRRTRGLERPYKKFYIKEIAEREKLDGMSNMK